MGQIASPGQLRMVILRWCLLTVPLILLLGLGVGELVDAGSGNFWYMTLNKPAFMPPGWLFGVVWTGLYILMGVAIAIIASARGARGRGLAVALFLFQLALNLAWTPLFFAEHEIAMAFGLLLGMLFFVALTILQFWRVRPLAALLLLPLFAWLIFAAVLNYEVLRLNPDAEKLAPDEAVTQIQF